MPNPGNLSPPFPKGTSGNPKGRPRLLVSSICKQLEEQGAERINAESVRKAYEYLIGLSIEELQAIAANKSNPAILAITAKELLGKNGHGAIKDALDRAHGKATQTQVLEGGEIPLTLTIVMPDSVTRLPTDA